MMISVFDGLQLLELQECRIVVLPDGRKGAIWRSLAYPLLPPGDQIEVNGVAIPPDRCTYEAATPTISFGVIDGVAEAYLVLPGSATACERSAIALREAGFHVLRTGRYLGEPIPGIGGDWFVRFAKRSDLTDLESLRSELASILGLTKVDLNEAESTSAETRSRLIAAELLAAKAREAGLRADIARLKGNAAIGEDVKIEAELLRQAIEEERGLREAAELAAAEAASVRIPPPAPRATPSPKLIDEIQIVIGVLLPRTNLLRDSLTVVAAEFSSRRALYRTLAELQDQYDRLPPSWKKLQGLESWWERHVSNGQDDAGRAYARRVISERKWDVLISHKGEQTRDLAWLSRQ
ncbi:hypothetical protein [Rhodoplanes sp. Z2-YC6860]|uniref:hypothetical protein n=1 Tax=Rhodoplanes sp. Z2-YC6860 TaxID=674703 RepID=UPI0012EE360B|nr:hypothetical protein [Rhodoplanes sp. Z2-YC6860]